MDWLSPSKPEDQKPELKTVPWRILIVDDEEEIHQVTKIAMLNFVFDDRKLKFEHAYSGDQAREIMRNSSDIALVLLDVVMESDNAGLDVAQYIRNELKNHYTRIVLRTGQPGQAPKEHVIRDYDIDGYKEKTELTQENLYLLFFTSLRSYRDIGVIQRHRQSLERIINSITKLNDTRTLVQFASVVLEEIILLVNGKDATLVLERPEAYAVSRNEHRRKVLAATGQYSGIVDDEPFDSEVKSKIDLAFNEKHGFCDNTFYCSYLKSASGSEIVISIITSRVLSPSEIDVLDIFSSNVAITYEALLMQTEIQETQELLINLLGESVESRSNETGAHVQRVGEYSAIFSRLLGFDETQTEMIRQAAPLHDVGKIGIPDAVLNKPAKLDATEWKVMQTHANIGYELLIKPKKPFLDIAASIAYEHHEKWDGSGYPRGLKGEEITIVARIVGLADVFDALCSKRCYKDKWQVSDACDFIISQSGKHFDPSLVELFEQNIDKFIDVLKRLPD